jgi:hypothetical protein
VGRQWFARVEVALDGRAGVRQRFWKGFASVKHPGSSGTSTEYPPSGSSNSETVNFRVVAGYLFRAISSLPFEYRTPSGVSELGVNR